MVPYGSLYGYRSRHKRFWMPMITMQHGNAVMCISGFGNCGFATFSDNLVQWNRSPLPLVIMSTLVLVGEIRTTCCSKQSIYLFKIFITTNRKHCLSLTFETHHLASVQTTILPRR